MGLQEAIVKLDDHSFEVGATNPRPDERYALISLQRWSRPDSRYIKMPKKMALLTLPESEQIPVFFNHYAH